ncbi:MAG: insulinase family protein [Saprospiraceae bacterium]|nr:MAG: insulinase family protein [Saprospiraceae bacterium]
MIAKKEAVQIKDGPLARNNEKIAGHQPIKPLGYNYETVPGDPLGVKIYTLQNGMKLYMSINDAEPRIYTNVPVRAGSKYDPAETTGLAHYLEHMMFKGTNKIGALDWEKEQVLLQKISDLYEQHRFETDPEKRKAIYRQIDETSGEAAKLVAANEYDKLVSSMGAKGTNAYTWVEQTVYVNDIPSNELERWMQLESERFKMVVLRLFHTELEAVYEEFNINQDRDYRKVSQAVNETLFPTHPYGTQTTIGLGEHLKNPSHVKIKEYFDKYYNPNNMAIVLAGDFNPDEAVAMAEKYFGSYQPKPIPPFKYEQQPELTKVVKKEVFGQEAANVNLAWRFDGANSKDADYITLISRLLYNRRAGLIDLDLVQKQLVLESNARSSAMEDFSIFSMYGKPREDQTLEEVEALLLAELEKIKKGDFEDWLPAAIIKDFKLNEIKAAEANTARASQMTDAFILGTHWADYVDRFKRMEAITKADIVRFANEHFKDNYVVVYKRTGDDPDVFKVQKPSITPVSVNRAETSAYSANFLAEESPRLAPVFVDFEKEIKTMKLESGVGMDYIKNKNNPTFSLNYIVEMGKNSDKELALAISYLPYLGTTKYSPEQLKQQFFKLGLNFNVNVSDERAYITLGGLDESLEEGIVLFEHILSNVVGNEAALANLVDDVLLERENVKKNKSAILRGAMYNYARYGKESPYTNNLTPSELRALTPELLVSKIKSLSNYEHRVFYYGSQEQAQVAALLNQYHRLPEKLAPVIPAKEFAEQNTNANEVIFVDFPMVQAEIMLVSKGTDHFNLEEYVMSELYNTYFGGGLSSIVFQEIRESRALAYSANAFYTSPSKEDEAHYLRAYVGTQADKMPDAIRAMQEIIENMPLSEAQIEQAIQSIQKKIETGRITKDGIYWSYRAAKDQGVDHDLRRDVYEKMKIATPEDLTNFHQKFVKGRNYTFLVLGSKESVNMDYLKTIGKVTELSLDEVFGYETKPGKP